MLYFTGLAERRRHFDCCTAPTWRCESKLSYLPCEFCKGFFQEKQLYLHVKSCMFRPKEVSASNYVRNARCMISPCIPRIDEDVAHLNSVIEKMRETERTLGHYVKQAK